MSELQPNIMERINKTSNVGIVLAILLVILGIGAIGFIVIDNSDSESNSLDSFDYPNSSNETGIQDTDLLLNSHHTYLTDRSYTLNQNVTSSTQRRTETRNNTYKYNPNKKYHIQNLNIGPTRQEFFRYSGNGTVLVATYQGQNDVTYDRQSLRTETEFTANNSIGHILSLSELNATRTTSNENEEFVIYDMNVAENTPPRISVQSLNGELKLSEHGYIKSYNVTYVIRSNNSQTIERKLSLSINKINKTEYQKPSWLDEAKNELNASELPDGFTDTVSDSGFVNASALAQNHKEFLESKPYTINTTSSTDRNESDNNETIEYKYNPNTSTSVKFEYNRDLNITNEEFVDFQEGYELIANKTGSNNTSYRRNNLTEDTPDTSDGLFLLYANIADYTLRDVVNNDNETFAVYQSQSLSNSSQLNDIDSLNSVIVVSEKGYFKSLNALVTFKHNNSTYNQSRTIRIEKINNTSVEKPSWVDVALNQTENETDNNSSFAYPNGTSASGIDNITVLLDEHKNNLLNNNYTFNQLNNDKIISQYRYDSERKISLESIYNEILDSIDQVFNNYSSKETIIAEDLGSSSPNYNRTSLRRDEPTVGENVIKSNILDSNYYSIDRIYTKNEENFVRYNIYRTPNKSDLYGNITISEEGYIKSLVLTNEQKEESNKIDRYNFYILDDSVISDPVWLEKIDFNSSEESN